MRNDGITSLLGGPPCGTSVTQGTGVVYLGKPGRADRLERRNHETSRARRKEEQLTPGFNTGADTFVGPRSLLPGSTETTLPKVHSFKSGRVGR